VFSVRYEPRSKKESWSVIDIQPFLNNRLQRCGVNLECVLCATWQYTSQIIEFSGGLRENYQKFKIYEQWQSESVWSVKLSWHFLTFFFFFLVLRSKEGFDLLIVEVSRSHSDTSQSIRLLWVNDQSVAETSVWQITTLTTDRHPCPRWEWNPRSHQASGHIPTP